MMSNQVNSSDLQGSKSAVGMGSGSAYSGLGNKVLNIDGKLPMPRRGILKSSGLPATTDLKEAMTQTTEIRVQEDNTLPPQKASTVSSEGHVMEKDQFKDTIPMSTGVASIPVAPSFMADSTFIATEISLENLGDKGSGQAAIISEGGELDQISKLAAKDACLASTVAVDDFTSELDADGAGKVDKSYASKLAGTSSPSSSSAKKVNFRLLESAVNLPGFDIVLPRQSVQKVHEKLSSTLFGYFIGTRVAFPVVEYFVKENWKPFGIQKKNYDELEWFLFL
jgi:hypothetical protein